MMRPIAAVLTGVLLSGGALACNPHFVESTWVQAVLDGVPKSKMIVLTDEQRDTFLRNFNAAPPVSDDKVDKIIVFRTPLEPRKVLVAFVLDGCIVKADAIPKPILERLLDGGA